MSSVVAGNVCYRATAKINSMADIGRIVLKKSADGDEVWSTIFRRAEARPPSRRFRHGHRDQLCEFAEVLGGCCEVELVAGAVRSS